MIKNNFVYIMLDFVSGTHHYMQNRSLAKYLRIALIAKYQPDFKKLVHKKNNKVQQFEDLNPVFVLHSTEYSLNRICKSFCSNVNNNVYFH